MWYFHIFCTQHAWYHALKLHAAWVQRATREKYSGRKYRMHKPTERDPVKYLIIRKSQQLIINGAVLSSWVHAGRDCWNVWYQEEWLHYSSDATTTGKAVVAYRCIRQTADIGEERGQETGCPVFSTSLSEGKVHVLRSKTYWSSYAGWANARIGSLGKRASCFGRDSRSHGPISDEI